MTVSSFRRPALAHSAQVGGENACGSVAVKAMNDRDGDVWELDTGVVPFQRR
jgi:hypothetical protein